MPANRNSASPTSDGPSSAAPSVHARHDALSEGAGRSVDRPRLPIGHHHVGAVDEERRIREIELEACAQDPPPGAADRKGVPELVDEQRHEPEAEQGRRDARGGPTEQREIAAAARITKVTPARNQHHDKKHQRGSGEEQPPASLVHSIHESGRTGGR